MNPLVSVVIPCFNLGAYVAETVRSVQRQTYKNIEIIIVDDGSTDGETTSILRKLQQPRLTILFKRNRGPAAARNAGIAKAQGKYIVALDADDTIEKTYIAKTVRVLETNPAVVIAYSQARFFGVYQGAWRLPKFSLAQMTRANCIFCSGMYARELWKKVGGYDPLVPPGLEDYEFWLSVLENQGTAYRIPEVLFNYRIRESSVFRVMVKSPWRHFKTKVYIFNKHRQFFTRHGRKNTLRYYAGYCGDLLVDCVRRVKWFRHHS